MEKSDIIPKKKKIIKKTIKEEKIKLQKPFLKWAGGKTQIIDDILKYFPRTMENYHEIFLGGGSVLLAILSLRKKSKITINNKIYAYDLNPSLINTFNQIKNNHLNVIRHISNIINEFRSIEKNTEGQRGQPKNITEDNYKTTREHYYYWTRNLYNKSVKNTPLSAAYFIFLNKTGFKGMYREGVNGFNIPYGQKDTKKIPGIIVEDDIKNISELIQDVDFICLDFTESLKRVGLKDFVYLDPPYAPENKNSFVGYTKDGFNIETHNKLFSEIKNINNKNAKFLLSNANVDLVTKNFEDFNCVEVEARRAIHRNKPGTKTTEVIIYN
jgi:DNA adenine methylase